MSSGRYWNTPNPDMSTSTSTRCSPRPSSRRTWAPTWATRTASATASPRTSPPSRADDGLRQLTRGSLRQRVVRLLRNRLSLTDLLRRYPEIEAIPIEKPFIVVGMPRSGTTHLVNLIAADPRRRALPYWESQDPIPARGQGARHLRGRSALHARQVRARRAHGQRPRGGRHARPVPRGDRGGSRAARPRPRRATFSNGMRACPAGVTTTWDSTSTGTTPT